MHEALEEWKDIPAMDGLYVVSNHGKVMRVKTWAGDKQVPSAVKPRRTAKGYLAVGLCKKSRCRYFKVHRLVAAVFIGECPAGLVVNHKDGNKENNCVWNLEYVTHRENYWHARGMGFYDKQLAGLKASRRSVKPGYRKPRANRRLSEHDVLEIRESLGTVLLKDMSTKYKMSGSAVYKVAVGKAYKDIGMPVRVT